MRSSISALTFRYSIGPRKFEFYFKGRGCFVLVMPKKFLACSLSIIYDCGKSSLFSVKKALCYLLKITVLDSCAFQ